MNATAILSTLMFVFSDGAEEEKMETETDGQQPEKVNLAQYTGSEKILRTLTNPNYYILKCVIRKANSSVLVSVCVHREQFSVSIVLHFLRSHLVSNHTEAFLLLGRWQ